MTTIVEQSSRAHLHPVLGDAERPPDRSDHGARHPP